MDSIFQREIFFLRCCSKWASRRRSRRYWRAEYFSRVLFTRTAIPTKNEIDAVMTRR